MSDKWCDLTDLLRLIKEEAFPNVTSVLCRTTNNQTFTLVVNNHGIFLDLSMMNNCTIFDVYELEDLLKWKYQIPNINTISFLKGINRMITLVDKDTGFCMVFMNGRKITFFDELENKYVFVGSIAEHQANKFYNLVIDIDSSRIDNIEDFMDSSFIPEEEEIELLQEHLDDFYRSVNNRMILSMGMGG